MWEEIDLNRDPQLDQIILFLFYKLKEKNMGVSRYGAQKTLYKLKKELGEDSSLYNSIPYYWYIHGPYSETLDSGLKAIINTPLLEKHRSLYKLNEDYYYLLSKNPEKYFPLIFDFFPVVDEIFDDLIKNKNRFYNLDKEIYLDYAPYSFMPPYKFEIYNVMDSTENYEYSIIDDILPTYFDCESKLPYGEFFSDYGEVYSDFVGVLDRFFTKDIINEYFEQIKANSLEIWSTFAQGLSYKYHDEFYEYKSQIWKANFLEQTHLLEDSIKKLRKIPREYKNSSNESKNYKFVSSTVEAYLRG